MHSEIRGTGAALVMIPGGGGDAGVYDDSADLLADRFRVLTYDRRGNSRSPLPAPGAAIDVPTQADDVIDLLDRHDLGTAAVFGSSAGALIALELLIRHPGRVSRVVVHEPPAVRLLGLESREFRELAGIRQVAEEVGSMRAFAAFGAMTMPDPPWMLRSAAGQRIVAGASRLMAGAGTAVRMLTRRPPSTMSRLLGNVPHLMQRELDEFLRYAPDTAALAMAGAPWLLATGVDSVGKPYHRPAHVLAESAGVPCLQFPGGHTVYQSAPHLFADHLIAVLEDTWPAQD